jgi:hypothetical protein
MTLFLAQFPAMTDATMLNGTAFTVGALVIVDRIVSIWTNLRRGVAPSMPREQIEERFAAHRESVLRLEKEIGEVDEARSRDVRLVCDQIRELNQSIGAAMNDVSRAMGRIEGGQEIARAIKEGFEHLARNTNGK